ncbi:MAG: CYTH domain-containing protein [Firmicutes bacterium]|nr:CYTH domain-containing protein [Bacillota bacterium]
MEIELKYMMEDEAVMDAVFQDPYIEMIKDKNTESSIDMYAVYFDTEERDLLREGIAFRIRREGCSLQATLKWNGSSEEGMHRREELNVAVDDPEKLHAPDIDIFDQSDMGDVLADIIGAKALVPMMEVDSVRHQVRIDTGKSISELSVDKGEVRVGEKTAPILELEIELFSGEEADMVALGDRLAEKYGLTASNVSKFKRGLDLMD